MGLRGFYGLGSRRFLAGWLGWDGVGAVGGLREGSSSLILGALHCGTQMGYRRGLASGWVSK